MNRILHYISLFGIILMFSCSILPKNIEPNQKENTKDKIKNTISENFNTNINNSEYNNIVNHNNIVGAKLNDYVVTRKYFPSLAQNFRQRYIILHYTSLNNEKSIEVLTKRNVSVHYLINDIDDEEIYQLVDGRRDNNLNDTSIGIEMVNVGVTEKCFDYENVTKCEKIFHDYPAYQIEKTFSLIKDIAKRYNIPPTNILAHSDIAPTRRHDPGPKFPWKKLYDIHQLGMWYDEDTLEDYMKILTMDDFENKKYLPHFVYKIQCKFNSFGYDIELSSQWSENTKKVIQAFQYHFRPEKGDGILDIQTYAILLSLLKKYPNLSAKNNI